MQTNPFTGFVRSRFVAVSLAVMLSGCAHTYTLTPGSPAEAFDRINGAVEGRTARILFVDDTSQRGAHVRITADSVLWNDPDALVGALQPQETGEACLPVQSVPTAHVKQITVMRRTRSALIGAAIGLVGGAAFGILPSVARGESFPADDDRLGSIKIFSPLFAAAGAIGGAVFGFKRGTVDTYVFSGFEDKAEADRFARHFAGRSERIMALFEHLRQAIRAFGPRPVNERITPSNVIYIARRTPFCYIVVQANTLQVYLAVPPTGIDDPRGLLRPWAGGDSTFRLTPDDDAEYAVFLIEQAYKKEL